MLAFVIFRTLIAILIGALLLRAAVRWVTGESITWSKSLLVAFALSLFSSAFGYALSGSSPSPEAAFSIAIWTGFISFFVQSGIIAGMVKISYGRAMLVALIMIAIIMAVVFVVLLTASLISNMLR